MNTGAQMPGMNLMGPSVSTEVLCLLNMVTEEELRDDDEFEGQLTDCHQVVHSCLLFSRHHGGCPRRMR